MNLVKNEPRTKPGNGARPDRIDRQDRTNAALRKIELAARHLAHASDSPHMTEREELSELSLQLFDAADEIRSLLGAANPLGGD